MIPVNFDITQACVKQKNQVFARKFVLLLPSDPMTFGVHLDAGYLLEFLKDEALIEQVDALMVQNFKDDKVESERFYLHYPAAYAWRKLGKVEKAVALYRPITEANGWSKSTAELAVRYIEEWEKEAKKP